MEGKPVKLKTYHAFTMAQALAAVKSDLGADAVILNTRTFKRGGILGIGRKTIVEVTATPAATPSIRPPALASKVRLKAAQARKAYAAREQPTAETAASATSATAAHSNALQADRERTRKLALALDEAHKRKQADQPLPAVEVKVRTIAPPSRSTAATPAAPVEKTAKRFLLTNPTKPAAANPPARGFSAQKSADSAPERPGPAAPAAREMQDELTAIRQMVGQVLQRQSTGRAHSPPTMPQPMFDMYLKLISQDISDELADQIVNAVRQDLTDAALDDAQQVRDAAMKHLAALIPVSGDVVARSSPDDRPLTIALVGPTGVGKTTTLAKLAAACKLRHGKSVGLITADTYRIAAVDQLRTYADIIGLPLQVALTPAEMKRAVNAFSDRDVVLIDTAGRSQKDATRISELSRFVAAAEPHEVHLVLSSAAGEKVLLQEAEAFSVVGIHNIVLTKLDEAVSFGMLVNVIRQVGKRLSFVTTGQEVPDHIEVGRAERLAELVVTGGSHLSTFSFQPTGLA